MAQRLSNLPSTTNPTDGNLFYTVDPANNFYKMDFDTTRKKLSILSTAIYVANQGSDINGNGSSLSPYQTISHALNQITDAALIKPYILILSPGLYSITGNFTLKPNISIQGNNSTIAISGSIAADASFLTIDSTSFIDSIIWNVASASNFDLSAKISSVRTNLYFRNNNTIFGSTFNFNFLGSYKECFAVTNSFWNTGGISSAQDVNFLVRNAYGVSIENKVKSFTTENTGPSFNRFELRGGLFTGAGLTCRTTSTGFQLSMIRSVGNLAIVSNGSSQVIEADTYTSYTTLNSGPIPIALAVLNSQSVYVSARRLNSEGVTSFGIDAPIFTAKTSDNKNAFNLTNSRFVAPIAGFYQFTISALFQTSTPLAGTFRMDCAAIKNGGFVDGTYKVSPTFTVASGTTPHCTVHLDYGLYLNAGEYTGMSFASNGTIGQLSLTAAYISIIKTSN